MLYRYTQVLRRPDLVNSKGKPLVTTARIEAVWKRLSARFTTIVADTSMITMSTAYAGHFHDIYIDGKEHAKMTGDWMKMLMVTLPFMERDLIRLYQKNPKIYHKNTKTDHKNPSDLDCSRLFYSALLRTFIAPDVPILSDVPPETHPPRKLFFIGVVESPVRSGWACQKIQKQYQINPKAIPN